MRLLGFVTGGILLLSGCMKVTPPDENLSCQLDTKEPLSCSSVLSLASGSLTLNLAQQHFKLVAHYSACYQTEDITMSGQYKQRRHQHIDSIELLAKQLAVSKSNHKVIFPRTIGLIRLNVDTKKGNFIDIWALIRAQSVKGEGLATVDVHCQSSFNKEVDNES